MGADATIYSISERISWNEPLLPADVKRRLTCFFQQVGDHFSYKGIIPGHLKLAVSPDLQPERYCFLSMTRVGEIGEKTSRQWDEEGNEFLQDVKLELNILIFGHDRQEIAQVVSRELNRTVLSSASESGGAQ